MQSELVLAVPPTLIEFEPQPAFNNLIVYHLQKVWREVLKAVWQGVLPMLEQAVDAWSVRDFGRLRPRPFAHPHKERGERPKRSDAPRRCVAPFHYP